MRCAISAPYCSMETSLMEEKYWSAPCQMSTGSHFFHCRSCAHFSRFSGQSQRSWHPRQTLSLV